LRIADESCASGSVVIGFAEGEGQALSYRGTSSVVNVIQLGFTKQGE